ncbi:hypothetical protein SAMN04488109_6068 [Chryseolinea serpens]|uniref:Beta-barrel porin-2, OmpL-like. bbp2 n=1 Tax=Chryseolinea serpens TaxID=947013 RepID=A0A1M5WXK2_9BACT|nr:hypothetical protein [Chryseolinea serpens]SHH91613.1 hypothetical protein SAMN04488109_6068 [Chryseolinea serpens]
MATKFHLSVILVAVLSTGLAQTKESADKEAGNAETNRFYYFEIPSAINGSNLDPSAISNVSSNFTDSKISFKLGFPSLFKDAPSTKDLKYTGFVQPWFKATNGATTLYKANSAPLEFGVNAGLSIVAGHYYWVFLDGKGNETQEHSSESMWWVNFIGSIDQGNYNLFNTTAKYDEILIKQTETNGSLYVSLNRYFYSQMTRYKWRSCIWSIGAGYAKTKYYSSLKNRTLETGKLTYNADSTAYQTVVETTSGRSGTLVIFEGLSYFGELFIPIVRNKTYGGVYWGNRLTYYGIGSDDYIANGVTGFYFNLKDKKVNGDKPAKDVLNFSVTAQFNQLDKRSEEDYIDKNFSIMLQAAIPLRFN